VDLIINLNIMDEENKEGSEQESSETTSNEPETIIENNIPEGEANTISGGDDAIISGDTN